MFKVLHKTGPHISFRKYFVQLNYSRELINVRELEVISAYLITCMTK